MSGVHERTHTLPLEGNPTEPLQDSIYVQTNPQPQSPVFRLPPELLRYVFRVLFDMHLQAITSFRQAHHWDIATAKRARPWTLSEVPHPWIVTLQVCRLWRWVAMDYGGLWTDITSRWPSPTRLALPPVEHIRIIDEALCMSNYLTCFPTSASDRFYYRFTIFDENSPSIANNIRQLAVLDLMSQVSSLIGAPVAYLDFADIIADCRPSHQLDFVASVASPFADSQTIPSLNLILDCIISRPDAHLRCLETLFDGLGGQLAHVRKLMLFGVDPYMSIDWARPFECMRNLRELVVSADEPDDIIELLGSLATEHRDERTGVTARELYFPALERITFSGMAREDERLDSVAQSLQKRMDLGSPLPVLVMYMVEDPLQPDDERLLSRVVSFLVSLNQMPGDTRPEIVNFVP